MGGGGGGGGEVGGPLSRTRRRSVGRFDVRPVKSTYMAAGRTGWRAMRCTWGAAAAAAVVGCSGVWWDAMHRRDAFGETCCGVLWYSVFHIISSNEIKCASCMCSVV